MELDLKATSKALNILKEYIILAFLKKRKEKGHKRKEEE